MERGGRGGEGTGCEGGRGNLSLNAVQVIAADAQHIVRGHRSAGGAGDGGQPVDVPQAPLQGVRLPLRHLRPPGPAARLWCTAVLGADKRLWETADPVNWIRWSGKVCFCCRACRPQSLQALQQR